ncbi:MAG TPA: glycosyltransferase family 2 protein [Pirellulales bacterium]|jgi:hypothetical protein
MKNSPPRVSIGLPVYNGQQYLAAAIDSLLAQTFTDFELVISDNASTDDTASICSEYAAQDGRIRYIRAETNRGAPWNFNQAFKYARGEYFKWHAADDLCAPTLIEQSVAALECNPQAVLCYPRTAVIDNQGNLLANAPGSWQPAEGGDADPRGLDSDRPSERMRGILMDTVWCYELFGLIRHEAMARTHLHRTSSTSGKAFLLELALQGKFVELPEVLFFNRRHAQQYTMLTSVVDQASFDQPGKKSHVRKLPHQIPCTLAYAGCVMRGPLTLSDRLRCCGVLARYVFQIGKWKRIMRGAWRGLGMWDGSLSVPGAEAKQEAPARPVDEYTLKSAEPARSSPPMPV